MILLVLVAATTVASAQLAPSKEEGPCELRRDDTTAVDVEWSRVESTPGCFFFSGPGDLGRDDSYGTTGAVARSGDRLVVRLARAQGEPPAEFVGAMRPDTSSATRVSPHAFGSTWETTESLRGLTACPLALEYFYTECDTSNRAACPGTCTIRARVTLTPR